MEQLNVDEIMALQAFGMKDAEIRKLHLDDFDLPLTLRVRKWKECIFKRTYDI